MSLTNWLLGMTRIKLTSDTRIFYSVLLLFYFQQKQHFVDISKQIETLLHLPVVTREPTGLIKLATETHNKINVRKSWVET